MATVDSLRRRVATLKARSNRDWIPRTWTFVLEVGEQLPPDVQARIDAEMRAHDQVIIRYAPQGFIGTSEREGGWSYGYVSWSGGSAVILQDGSLERVRKR